MATKRRITKTKTDTKPEEIEQKQCIKCLEYKDKISNNFFISYNENHGDGLIPICKTCIKKMIDPNDISTVKSFLKEINRPFIFSLWESSIQTAKNKNSIIGIYLKNINMPQYRSLVWDDVSEEDIDKDNAEIETDSGQYNSYEIFLENFKPTNRIIEKWGYGYSNEEYYFFEKKWNNLIDNYGKKTSFHTESLVTYIRFRVKEELATAQGKIKEAKEWGTMARDAATAAKINVSQLSKSDITGGIDLLPQLFEAVESKVGIIPILPKLKEQPYDDADLIIWTIVNYIRRLEDKSRVEYKDIWVFYDQMLEEFYKQKGYTKDMINKEKEKRNNIFRDLSAVYKEPIYEEDGDL